MDSRADRDRVKKRSEEREYVKREFLRELGIEDEVLDKIIIENGKDVQGLQAQIESLTADRDGLREQLAAANEQIEGFKELDVDGIKAKADEWKQKAEQAERELDERIADIQFDHALEKQLAGAKARDAGIIMGLLDREGLKLTDDGKILGLEEQLSKIKEEKGFLFESEDEGMPQIVRGGTGGGGGSANDTAAARAVMGLPPEEK